MKTTRNTTLRLAAILFAASVATLALAAPAMAKGKAPCASHENDFTVKATFAGADANTATGGNHHYPVVQFVVATDLPISGDITGAIREWGRGYGDVTLTHNDATGQWESLPLPNPTPTQTLSGKFAGASLIGSYEACHVWQPLASA